MDRRQFFILLVFLFAFILPDAEFGYAEITKEKQELQRNGVQVVMGNENGGWFPVNDGRYEMPFKDDNGSRPVAPFSVSQCSSCTCCTAGNTTCIETSCCYVLTCSKNGICSSKPVSCDCSNCY